MEILWLNWRDLRHPKAGGAEVYTHEVARRLVDRGHGVTLFVAAAPGIPASERIDGVRIVRRGGAFSTRLRARQWLKALDGSFDVLVEEINTLPYAGRRWSGLPTLVVVHQIAREVWWWEAPWYVAPFGRALEPVMLRAARGPAIALSESTRSDLVAAGFDPAAVRVIYPGISTSASPPVGVPVEHELFAYVGRLAPSKRVDHCIRALGALRRAGQPARLAVVGHGDPRVAERLRQVATDEGVAAHVRFHDYLSDRERDRLLASATAVVMASVREGWGMSITEANALGTPAVVYRRPGLCDSTRDGKTGIVVDPNPLSLAKGMARLMDEPGLRDRLARGAREWAAQLTWEATADAVEESLVTMVAHGGGRG